jgi:hypothetical protein
MQLPPFVQQGLHEAVGEVTEKGVKQSCRSGAILSNPVSLACPRYFP